MPGDAIYLQGVPDSTFVLCFARFQTLPGDVITLGKCLDSRLYCVFHSLKLCQVMQCTCRERLDSRIVLRSVRFEALR